MSIGVTEASCGARLATKGYAVIKGALPRSTIAAIDRDLAPVFADTPFCRGPFYGETTKRFGRLLTRSPLAERLVLHPGILALADHVLGPWCDTIQLNLAQAIEIHPGAPAQFPLRDQEMWRGALGTTEYLLNVMWPLVSFTAANGATLIWPDSHGAAALAPDPVGPPVAAIADPGDAVLFLGSTLHGAGANVTGMPRRGIIVSYCLGWLKPYENQWLTYPPAVARHFSPELAALVGYRQHRPNLGNVEGQCPSILFDGELAGPVAATDALRPDQTTMLADFVARRSATGTAPRR